MLSPQLWELEFLVTTGLKDCRGSMRRSTMILGGMGPVLNLYTTYGKLFASAYALFSGVVFIGVMGIILAAPVGSVIK